MDRSGWIVRTILCLLWCLITGCHAGNKWQKQVEDKSIVCYQCNSEYDPRCGDPFDPYSLGTVNCSMKKPLEHMTSAKPVLCRKTVQKVQGHTRVIRGCGYITDPRDDKECIRRTGTHEVILRYCSCTKNLCNAAYTNRPPPATAVLATMGALLTAWRLA